MAYILISTDKNSFCFNKTQDGKEEKGKKLAYIFQDEHWKFPPLTLHGRDYQFILMQAAQLRLVSGHSIMMPIGFYF